MKRCSVLLSFLMLLCIASGCTPVKQQNIDDLHKRKRLCSSWNLHAKEGCFSVVFDSVDGMAPGKELQNLFPYPCINLKVVFSHFEPGKYFLYCPNTGCPLRPELSITLACNSKGVMRVYIPEFEGYMPEDMEFSPSITVWGIPGFCADWYLFTEDGSSTFHTTFVYEPITSTNDLGQSVTIYKKECGGNLLEVCFKGFQPGEAICWSAAEGDKISHYKNKADSKGCYSYQIWPGAKKMDRGTVVISIDAPSSPLQAKVDWDSKTLFVQRTQPRSSTMLIDLSPPGWEVRELKSAH